MWFLSDCRPAPMLLAYLDPGSGSLLLQVLIAGLLSGLFFLKSSLGDGAHIRRPRLQETMLEARGTRHRLPRSATPAASCSSRTASSTARSTTRTGRITIS